MKKTFLPILLAIICFSAHAQNDEITLVVDGEGPTKEEATKNALRSAIEQAFGTFVSANTTILNDDLVKDEIVTISSGNIKTYKELSSMRLANDFFSVTVSATVSIGKLISYIQSKGASTEFAGQTFMMNMKMRELNKTNETLALQHLVAKLRAVSHTFYDYSLEVKSPQETTFYEYKKTKSTKYSDFRSSEKDVPAINGYKLPLVVTIRLNSNFRGWVDDLYSTLSAIALSNQEISEYKSTNSKFFRLSIFSRQYYFRNDPKSFGIQLFDALQAGLLFDLIEKYTNKSDVIYHFSLSVLNNPLSGSGGYAYNIPSSYGGLIVNYPHNTQLYSPWATNPIDYSIKQQLNFNSWVDNNDNSKRSAVNQSGLLYDCFWEIEIPLLLDKESLYSLTGIDLQTKDPIADRILKGESIFKDFYISETERQTNRVETLFVSNLDSGDWSDWKKCHSTIDFDIQSSSIEFSYIQNGKYSVDGYREWEDDKDGWKRVMIDCFNTKGDKITIKLRRKGNERQVYILPKPDNLRSFCLQIQKPQTSNTANRTSADESRSGKSNIQSTSSSSAPENKAKYSVTVLSDPAIDVLPVRECEPIPYGEADSAPRFNGGNTNEFIKWMNSLLEYPQEDKENGIQGRVNFQFTVTAEGTVQDIKVTRGVSPSLDEEAVRVVSLSPKWIPATKDGCRIPVIVKSSCIFQLR